jgi:hypothetical protein
MYVCKSFSISNRQLLSRAEVHLLHRWLPWNWHRSVPRSTCSCFHGRVRRTVRKPRTTCLIVLDRWIFFALSLLGLRQWLARIMPQSLVLSVGAGIGLFIACVTCILFLPSPLLTRLQFHRTLYATIFLPPDYTSNLCCSIWRSRRYWWQH